MRKIYGAKNPHDEFEAQWLASDIDKKYKEIEIYNKECLDIINRYIKKQDKIIEAGCGLGQFVLYYKNKGYDILGVDFSQKAIDKLIEYNSSLNVSCADCTNLPFKDNTFDMYLSFGVVEHAECGPEIFLNEAYRIIKPGEYAFITVPNEECCVYNKIYSLEKQKQNKIFFEYGFSKDEFCVFLERCGFEIVEYRYHTYFVPLNMNKLYTFKGKQYSFKKQNIIGKAAEKIYSYFNECKHAWMFGIIARKK